MEPFWSQAVRDDNFSGFLLTASSFQLRVIKYSILHGLTSTQGICFRFAATFAQIMNLAVVIALFVLG